MSNTFKPFSKENVMNMYRSKRGASVGRAELARINADRDARAFYATVAGPFTPYAPRDPIAEKARANNIRMLADQIEHLKFITRGY
jgi:hypothetical protein